MRTFGHDKNHIIEYMQTALLSSVYFGPVQWFQKLNRFETCIIEQYDNFVTQPLCHCYRKWYSGVIDSC